MQMPGHHRKWILFVAQASFLFVLAAGHATGKCTVLVAQQDATAINRSPVDLVLGPDESWLVTANQTSHSVSLVDLSQTQARVLDEISVGERPEALALVPGKNQILVTCGYSGEFQRLSVAGNQLRREAVVHLGFHPHGIAVADDGRRAYVSLADADQIAVIDLENNQCLDKIDVGRWPRYLALSADESRLVVGTSGDRGISIVDLNQRKLLHIDRFVGLNIGQMQLAPDGQQVYFPWIVYRRNPINERNIRQGWVLASRLGRIGFADNAHREALSLDPSGEAIADPHGMALTPDGRQVVVSAAGTHELVVMQLEGLPFQDRGSTDHIDAQLLGNAKRFMRIPLGGRPLGLRVARDSRTVFVANYLDNSIQVVDLENQKLRQRIELGGEAVPSLARRGEAIFFDGRRSLDQWYSCHSCHYEGGSNAVAMDTQNDGTPLTFKTVLPLYELDQTGPWTWHGWQTDLNQAMRHSLSTTMLGKRPEEDDVSALVAYFSQLRTPPNSWQVELQTEKDSARATAVKRGEQVFNSAQAACAECHIAPRYTDGEIHDLGLGDRNDAHRGFNTPSLQGVFRKVVLLHDGRVANLAELLRGPHAPDQVSGQPLSEQDLRDLIEYLKTL